MCVTEPGVRARGGGSAWWLVLGAVGAALAGIVLGLIGHSEGTMGRGGVECGSVFAVSAYHSGCQTWLDGMSRAVFVLLGLSTALLLAALVRAWRGSRVGMTLVILVGLGIAVVGPRIWREAVFVTFGY